MSFGRNKFICLSLSIAAGGALAATSLHSISFASTLWGWICALLLYEIVLRAKNIPASMFVTGIVFHAIAFYWLVGTLDRFGGFGPILAFFLFVLFCLISSLQFFMFGWLCSKIRATCSEWWLGVSCAVAWMFCEVLVPRLFPWSLSSSQIWWSSFAYLASVAGVSSVSGCMVMVVAAARDLATLRKGSSVRFSVLVILMFFVLLIQGRWSNDLLREEMAQAPHIRVAVVQGNLSTKVKGNVEYLEANLDTYRKITGARLANKPDLIVWPESVSTRWMPHETVNLGSTPYDVFAGLDTPLLFGALTYEERSAEELELAEQWYRGEPEALQSYMFKRYNSAVGRSGDAKVVGIFSKRVLMPLGEYLPFEDTFPFVRKLSPQSGSFSVGEEPSVIHFSTSNGKAFSVAPLICYEDLVPSLSRAAVLAGSQLLVNLTNDAWYGDTAAPYQHNLLASWRAVESRRYLLRATNTGLTAVISPLGELEQTLPTFEEGSLIVEVPLLGSHSFYHTFGAINENLPLVAGTILLACLIFYRRKGNASTGD